eukprot:10490548-Lingulodinium_polyedra.AAC.1
MRKCTVCKLTELRAPDHGKSKCNQFVKLWIGSVLLNESIILGNRRRTPGAERPWKNAAFASTGYIVHTRAI